MGIILSQNFPRKYYKFQTTSAACCYLLLIISSTAKVSHDYAFSSAIHMHVYFLIYKLYIDAINDSNSEYLYIALTD